MVRYRIGNVKSNYRDWNLQVRIYCSIVLTKNKLTSLCVEKATFGLRNFPTKAFRGLNPFFYDYLDI